MENNHTNGLPLHIHNDKNGLDCMLRLLPAGAGSSGSPTARALGPHGA